MCEQKRGVPVGGVLLAVGVLAAVGAGGAVAASLGPLLAVLGVVEVAAVVVMLGALVWLLRYGGWHRPARERSHYGEHITARAALPGPRKAISQAGAVTATVLSRRDEKVPHG